MVNRKTGRIPAIIQILKAAVGQSLTASEIQAAYNEMHPDENVDRETILMAVVGYIRRHGLKAEILQRGNEFVWQGPSAANSVAARQLKYAARVNARRKDRETTEVNAVNHPRHYGGENNPYEAIKVIEAWELGFNLGNTVKYISRAGLKHAQDIEDLEKAAWYLNREIVRRKAATEAAGQ
jgi:hypothetical protein